MSKKSTVGLRARVVASRRTMCQQVKGLSARARQYGRTASTRVQETLSACAAAAVPQARLHPAIETLEGRQMLSAAPATVYSATAAPDANSQNVFDGIWTGNNGLELGAKFNSDVNGTITGVRFFKGSLNTGPHTGEVWSSGGTLLATASFTNETASGWEQANFSSPVAVTAGTTYVVSYHTDAQYMAFSPYGLSSEQSNGALHLLADGQNGADGLYSYGGSSVFPTQSYLSGSYWVDAVFSAAATTASTVYSASTAPAASDQNVWDGVNGSNGGLELGAKFTSDVSGYVTGVQFYKGSLDTGPHTGELWKSGGTLLATASFSGESAAGWEQVNFSSPVAVNAGQVYVVSFHTDAQYMAFSPYGLSSELSNGSLHLLGDGQSGTDGVFSYGATSLFPSQSYLSGSYWVDPVFSTTATTVPPAPASPPPPPIATGVSNAYAPSALIGIQGGNGQAGHSVFVNGLASPLGDGNQLTAKYSWNFGDTASTYNNLTGWNAGHIYDNPGTYLISLTVTNDLGLSSTAYSSVTITPSTRTTIYVNVYGNDANNGLSANTPVASETRLEQVLSSYGNSNVTVLFARGETFNMPYYLYVEGSNEIFSAYGSGAAPVLYKTVSPTGDSGVFYMTTAANQVVIENLTFDSPNAASIYYAPDIVATGIYANGTNLTIRNNTFLNMEDAIDCYQGPNGILVENNSAPLLTGLRGYFVWMNGTNGVVLGNSVINSTRQHVMRSNYTTSQDWLIAGNNFTSGDNTADVNEPIKTTIYLRLGQNFYLTGNTLNDDPADFGPTDDMPTTATVSWIKFDGNFVNNAQVILHGSVQHMMISNNLTNLAGIYPQYQIQPTDDMGRQMSEVTMANNTGTLVGNLGYFVNIEGSAQPSVLTIKNNLFAAPNLAIGYDMASSVFMSGSNASSVYLFSHNVWAAPSTFLAQVMPTAVNYIAPAGVLNEAYFLTVASWDSLANVQDDQFRAVTVSASNLQTSIDGQMAGAVLPSPLY